MQIHISKSEISPPLGILFSVLSGILLFSSFVYLPYLSFIAFLPLLFLIDKSSLKRLFYYGMIAGFTLYIPLLYFILVMEVPIRFYLYLGVFILWLYLSLYYGLWCYITKLLLIKTGVVGWIISAAFFVSLEFLRSLTREIGFPWGTIGYTLVPQRYFIQIADITGIAGLSFIVILTNILLYNSFTRPKIIIPLLIILSSVMGYSKLRIKSINKLMQDSDIQQSEISILIVQPNISHEVKRRGDIVSRINIFKSFSESDSRHDLIIWPESALPGYMIEGSKPERLTRELVDSLQTPVLTGGTRLSYDEEIIKVYNSSVLVEPYKGIVDFYDKIYLVPFGERLPFDDFFPVLKRLEFGQGGYSPGDRRTLFELNGVRFGVLICFESTFPRHVNKFVKEGADFMVNITDDSWFGRTVGPYEHSRMALLRAVETRKPFIRCANSGISYIVNPDGLIKHSTKLFERTSISDNIYLKHTETFYTKYGDVFSYVMLLFSFVGILSLLFIQRPERL